MALLLTLEEAQERVLAHARPLPAEDVPVAAAAGRVAVEDVRARVDLPPFASSAMDGFALRASDVPATLRVTGESAAGRPFDGELAAGEAVAISTGGVVPDTADAVVPVEYVVKTDDTIEVSHELAVGANVRPRGGDVSVGGVVVPAGGRLEPARIAAAAAAGVAVVSCARRPRVAVVATGSELVAPGEPLEQGQVYEANTFMLAAALSAVGAEVVTASPTPDESSALRAVLEQGLDADVLVTSGGVSVGEHDLVRAVEEELGVDEIFWRVAIKPGKPISFGVRGETLVFGLPGNPVSALVGCELFVKPAVRALQGATEPLPRYERGSLGGGLRRNEERDEFVRARAVSGDSGAVLEPVVGQQSHMIARAATADALVHVPRGNGELKSGSRVSWLRLGTA